MYRRMTMFVALIAAAGLVAAFGCTKAKVESEEPAAVEEVVEEVQVEEAAPAKAVEEAAPAGEGAAPEEKTEE